MGVTCHASSGFVMPVLGTALFVALAQGGEWHTGHQVWYRSACHDKAKMTAVAEAAEVSLRAANEHFTRLVREGECTFHQQPVAAFLLERVSGPYASPDGPTAHVWRIFDAVGDEKYILLRVDTGPHHGLQPSN